MSSAVVHFRKSPGDVVDLIFDFTDLLASAEELSGTPTVTKSVLSGTETSALSLDGACTLVTGNKKCQQQVSAGTAGTIIQLRVAATTDTGSPAAHVYERDFVVKVDQL